ncbi:MAG: ribose 5-phosphate isomerase A [Acidilobaceae archaeon]
MSCDPAFEAARGALELLSTLKPPRLIGFGTGHTVGFFMDLARGYSGSWLVVASSIDTAVRASRLGFNVLYPPRGPLDVYVDGIDEVDPSGNMVKGGGGALLGEKILAFNSGVNIFIASEDKLVDVLGSRRPIPVEVVRDYAPLILGALESLGFKVSPREGSGKRGPVVSDWGGVIVDVHVNGVRDPEALETTLRSIPGVVETGLFIGYADYIVVGFRKCGYKVLRFERRRSRR